MQGPCLVLRLHQHQSPSMSAAANASCDSHCCNPAMPYASVCLQTQVQVLRLYRRHLLVHRSPLMQLRLPEQLQLRVQPLRLACHWYLGLHPRCSLHSRPASLLERLPLQPVSLQPFICLCALAVAPMCTALCSQARQRIPCRDVLQTDFMRIKLFSELLPMLSGIFFEEEHAMMQATMAVIR